MRHPLRVLALALMLSATPACASLQWPGAAIENPIDAARTVDQRAYALLHAYGAILEEAADIVRDPATPLTLKRALGQAERVATPTVETLQIAVTAYIRASETPDDRIAAANTLNAAIAAAEAPVAELQALVRARRS